MKLLFHLLLVFCSSLYASAQIKLLPPEQLMSETYALVIGVADYQHIGDLRFSDDDAYHIYSFMLDHQGWRIPRNNIHLLIDQKATKQNIILALNDIVKKVKPADNILLYFSGHGAKGGLATYDTSQKPNSILSHFEIKSILKKAPTNNQYCFIDACFSGSFEQAGYFGVVSDLLYGYKNSGITMMLASSAQEESLEHPVLRQGFFTYFLVEGLKGKADLYKDRKITLSELFSFVSANVKYHTKNAQNPLLTGESKPMAVMKYY